MGKFNNSTATISANSPPSEFPPKREINLYQNSGSISEKPDVFHKRAEQRQDAYREADLRGSLLGMGDAGTASTSQPLPPPSPSIRHLDTFGAVPSTSVNTTTTTTMIPTTSSSSTSSEARQHSPEGDDKIRCRYDFSVSAERRPLFDPEKVKALKQSLGEKSLQQLPPKPVVSLEAGRRKAKNSSGQKSSTDLSQLLSPNSNGDINSPEHKMSVTSAEAQLELTSSGRNRGLGKANEPRFDCQVCGDVAAGFHCGAYVCEACKVSSKMLTICYISNVVDVLKIFEEPVISSFSFILLGSTITEIYNFSSVDKRYDKQRIYWNIQT